MPAGRPGMWACGATVVSGGTRRSWGVGDGPCRTVGVECLNLPISRWSWNSSSTAAVVCLASPPSPPEVGDGTIARQLREATS